MSCFDIKQISRGKCPTVFATMLGFGFEKANAIILTREAKGTTSVTPLISRSAVMMA